jgi:hypothetical protein
MANATILIPACEVPTTPGTYIVQEGSLEPFIAKVVKASYGALLVSGGAHIATPINYLARQGTKWYGPIELDVDEENPHIS